MASFFEIFYFLRYHLKIYKGASFFFIIFHFLLLFLSLKRVYSQVLKNIRMEFERKND